MAVVKDEVFSFTDTANNVIDMSDTLYSISPSDIPLLNLIGKDSLAKPCRSVKHEWLESSLRPLDGAVANDTSWNNTTDPLPSGNVVAGQGLYLGINDILKVESELVRVTLVTSDAITLARGYGGSTIAAHAANTPWSIVGRVDVQNAGVPTPRTTTVSGRFNYTQIYNDSVKVTSTAQAIEKYTKQDLLATGVKEALLSMWMTWERALLHGRKVAPSSTVSSAMDGILPVITTNAYAKAGAALVEDFLLQALQDTWAAGGSGRKIAMVGAFQKRRINQLLDSQRMTTRTDRTAGVMIDRYQSDFGELEIILNRNMPTDTVLIIEPGRIGFGPLKNHSMKAAAIPKTTESTDVVQIWGQYTSELRNEAAHAKITGLATT